MTDTLPTKEELIVFREKTDRGEVLMASDSSWLLDTIDAQAARIAELEGEVLTALNDLEHERITAHNLRTRLSTLQKAAGEVVATRNDGCDIADRVSPFMLDALAAAIKEGRTV